MSDLMPKPARPWRLIAEEASREDNPQKVVELMDELRIALEDHALPAADTEVLEEPVELQKAS